MKLRPAEESDRRAVYEWMTLSDAARAMLGPPLYPEVPVPTWEEFCDDYEPYFFDGSQPQRGRSFIIEVDGEPAGHTNYYASDEAPGVMELDIWLASEQVTGHGYGTAALQELIRYLHETQGATEFVIRPSARNQRAVRAYTKVGFELLDISAEEQTRLYGEGDYSDSVAMVQRLASKA